MKIMIVEDEQEYTAKISGIVIGLGHEATCYESGREVLLAYDDQKPDMVITDYAGFPVGGIRLSKKIRGSGDGIPVYIQSGVRPQSHEMTASGADGFIHKSRIEAELPEILRKHFGGNQ
ncbi:MAG: response regulator [Candidatus Aenigmarchaeota archaeon]|nr:response regulator [Candidatus Aenigmarchaeota archaeon]MDI6722860.1 response regulator [Candidatus Aenigmarchaeota archaeon]